MAEKQASAETMDFIAELDAEFGKKVKAKGSREKSDNEIARERNTLFHQQHPTLGQGPRGQLERMKFENYYDWEMHRQAILDKEVESLQEAGVPELQWLPEARVTYIINQCCACCKTVTQFVGNEYIRFRGRRRRYKTLEGDTHETWPTMLRRVSEVDSNLVAFGIPGGDPLPDLVDELDETVARCPGCIQVERQALDLWIRATQPSPQQELDIDIPLTGDGR